MEPAPVRIDYRPLEAPVTRRESGRSESPRRRREDWRYPHRTKSIFVAVIVVFGLFSPAGGVVFSLFSAPGGGLDGATLFLVLPLSVIAIATVVTAFRAGGRWEKALKLSRFAEANGMRYTAAAANPWYPGMIFQRGDSRSSYDSIASTGDRLIDIGNHRYTTGSGKHRTTHEWGFLVFELDRALPHMLLDSRANDGLFGMSNLPTSFNRNQVLSLEGDFDKFFTLYCPREYERDALYVFTPDLMALLIDEAAPFDVEIVDTWMFVYSSKPFDPVSRITFERLFRIVRTVGAKAPRQTDRYRDDRIASFEANVVAPQGRRLKGGVSVGAVVMLIVFAAVWIWGTVGGGLTG